MKKKKKASSKSEGTHLNFWSPEEALRLVERGEGMPHLVQYLFEQKGLMVKQHPGETLRDVLYDIQHSCRHYLSIGDQIFDYQAILREVVTKEGKALVEKTLRDWGWDI